MDIKRVAIDALNEVIVLTVPHMDYKGQVAKRINEKMPLATVKGFRKGAVPKNLVEKHYGKAIKEEEVKKVVDLALTRYIQSERLALLGTPLAKTNESFSWSNEELVFEYEIGLVPDFELNLEAKNDIKKYVIVVDEVMVNRQIARIQKQYGKIISQHTVAEGNDVSGTFVNETAAINNRATLDLEDFADPTTVKKFIGKKVGDALTLNTKSLFIDYHKLMDYMNINHDDVHTLDVEVTFTIDEVVAHEPAELNQELFDKLFGTGVVNSIDELKAKIKVDAEVQLAQQADQKLLADVQGFLVQNTPFELPKQFLIKWLQTAGEKKLTPEEGEIKYNRSENALRFRLIENKAMTQNNIPLSFEDLKSYAAKSIRQLMMQFVQMNLSDEEVEKIVARVLSNQDEVKRMSDQVVAEKLLHLLIEKANPTTTQVNYGEFIKAMYGELAV
jgi:trigger factor